MFTQIVRFFFQKMEIAVSLLNLHCIMESLRLGKLPNAGVNPKFIYFFCQSGLCRINCGRGGSYVSVLAEKLALIAEKLALIFEAVLGLVPNICITLLRLFMVLAPHQCKESILGF